MRRIREQRASARLDIGDLLTHEISRDPFTDEKREEAHLFLVAEPAYADPELPVGLEGDDWRRWLVTSACSFAQASSSRLS